MNKFEDRLFKLLSAVLIFGAGLLALIVPVVTVSKVIVTQQVLNQECGTNYSFLQVALAGSNLSRICQSKNQTITVK